MTLPHQFKMPVLDQNGPKRSAYFEMYPDRAPSSAHPVSASPGQVRSKAAGIEDMAPADSKTGTSLPSSSHMAHPMTSSRSLGSDTDSGVLLSSTHGRHSPRSLTRRDRQDSSSSTASTNQAIARPSIPFPTSPEVEAANRDPLMQDALDESSDTTSHHSSASIQSFASLTAQPTLAQLSAGERSRDCAPSGRHELLGSLDGSARPARIKTIGEIVAQSPGIGQAQYSTRVSPIPSPYTPGVPSDDTPSQRAPRPSLGSLSSQMACALDLHDILSEETLLREPTRSDGSCTHANALESQTGPRKSTSESRASFTSTRLTPDSSSRYSTDPDEESAMISNSSRFTTLLRLELGLVVSFADIGDAAGHPVFIFLGLGCVRYLVGLYEEIAASLGLRLICIDRWGLGRTTAVSEEQRSFDQWATIVEEVANKLDVKRFSILAHSAGAAYALATAIRVPHRLAGSLHLLAPWVPGAHDSLSGPYRLLRYLPTGIIKTAQAAEWSFQDWRLGRPLAVRHSPIGFDRTTGVLSSPASPTSPKSRQAVQSVLDTTPPRRSSRSFLSRLLGLGSTDSTEGLATQSRISASGLAHSRSSMSIESQDSTVTPSRNSQDLAAALLRASHAESQGSSADLGVILNYEGTFDYSGMSGALKVWYGDRDDRISLTSMKALERAMPACQLRIVPGADHSLMTSELSTLRQSC